jgi:hypothetical protein|tara:strand:- start:3289 stop:3471 length:183 start_codon:yes stop_codon:yes gene_type:complete
MTLIIKELIIKGNIIKDPAVFNSSALDEDMLEKYLDAMKTVIKKECVEEVLRKIEKQNRR